MSDINFEHMTEYAKQFAGLTPEREEILKSLAPVIVPRLSKITDAFYGTLSTIKEASPFLEGRIDVLKQTHLRWLTSLFSGTYDSEYTKAMHRVGDVHVKVKLPVEFMAGGTTLIGDLLLADLDELFRDDPKARTDAVGAVNAILGFSLIIMQQSFQDSSLHAELEKFLKITGMSRALFNNLAAAYR
ncbi:MAG: hypothetical protein FIA97_05350 [Methylococcaceae bacterium]|nr:hypothetical protein [Methylococcaceae bacterium]